jgi:hypothetical protein
MKTKPFTTTMRVIPDTSRRLRELCDRLGFKFQAQTEVALQNRITDLEKLEKQNGHKPKR